MTANPWILALHLIALFFWLGQLILLPRLLAHAAAQPEDARRAQALRVRRMWNTASPFGLVVLGTGLLMLHGVGSPAFASVGDALKHHFKPTDVSGAPTYWYVTFHVKLVAFVLLASLDFWLGAQASRVARGDAPARTWTLAAPLALIGALLSHVTVWLTLSELGVVPGARSIGFGAALIGGAVGVFAARKLGRSDSAAKYYLVHGAVAAVIVLIVILIVAKPLSFAGSTLG